MTETLSAVGVNSVVHVVDDDESLRLAVARLLRAEGYEVRTYASAGEFALQPSDMMTGCVLLDVRMPGPSGLDLQIALRGRVPHLPVIFLTGHGDIPMSVQAMKAGATDFLTKPVERTRLLSAIGAAMTASSKHRNGQENLARWQERLATLSPRERDVFERVTEGQPNKLIAGEISISERTVKAHRAEVMKKMGASSLAELVHIADALNR